MRTQKKKDPFKYYEVLKVLGDGSMGSVCKVKKKKSAVGGSARKTFLERQKRNSLLQMLPCLSICLPGDATEETKKGALVSANGYNVDYLTGSTRGNSSSPSVGSRSSKPQNPKTLTKKSSSMISYMDDYGVVYALKSIILDQVTNAIFVRELQNEIALLRTLDHPNICKAIETYDFKKQLYLVLELCSGGDLYSRDPYDESNARYIVHSILDACTYMHKKNITHRDRESVAVCIHRRNICSPML
jgi:serine/threonine protein kinase